VPEPPHVLKFKVPRVIKINMRLRDAACQQHPGARPVKIPEKLDEAVRTRPATVRLVPAPLMTWHTDIVQRPTGLRLHADERSRSLPSLSARSPARLSLPPPACALSPSQRLSLNGSRTIDLDATAGPAAELAVESGSSAGHGKARLRATGQADGDGCNLDAKSESSSPGAFLVDDEAA
jgi:hypothetical protein